MELLEKVARPRAVGTVLNDEITDYIGAYLEDSGYEVNKIPFDCKVWKAKESFLVIDGNRVIVQVSPYSEAFIGTRKTVTVRSLEELEKAECEDKLLFLTEELSEEGLQPKNYPFYYPEEHKALIDCLEEKKPCAIIAVTGRSSMSGLEPFPVIEDGSFHIPVGSISKECFAEIEATVQEKEVEVSFFSKNSEAIAHQLIASKKVPNPQGTIVICAHMDSKYNTDGALDNASGVVTMLLAAKGIESDKYNIDIVPFNSEEYYEPKGELIYLDEIQKSGKEIKLLVNIDTVAHVGSKVAAATFNFDEKEQKRFDKVMEECENVVAGEPWYAGDHAAFAFNGTKCVLISASDLFEECVYYTHCSKDTVDLVDRGLIENAAEYICKVVNSYL